ncbi:AAA family ATPase [Nocardioides currus]|nr:ATP-binding protein [Nocardioides currus]
MTGLPGSGKSTVAHRIAGELGCAVISVDTIERGLHDAGVDSAQPVGLAAYAVANRLVDVQLSLGHTVVADAVNDHPEARQAWLDLAERHGVDLRVVHVRCSDETLHRQRLETRDHELREVPWERVVALKDAWTPWPVETELVETSGHANESPQLG